MQGTLSLDFEKSTILLSLWGTPSGLLSSAAANYPSSSGASPLDGSRPKGFPGSVAAPAVFRGAGGRFFGRWAKCVARPCELEPVTKRRYADEAIPGALAVAADRGDHRMQKNKEPRRAGFLASEHENVSSIRPDDGEPERERRGRQPLPRPGSGRGTRCCRCPGRARRRPRRWCR